MFVIPDIVVNKARDLDANAWLAGLPDTVADLASSWDISIGAVYEDATEAFVCEAANGAELFVLKIPIPRVEASIEYEALVLRFDGGRACAHLLREDAATGALLLERLGTSLSRLGLSLGRRLEILCHCAERLWRPAPTLDLPSGAVKARWLSDFIAVNWLELDQPCSEQAFDHAVACADRRANAHDPERSVLVHGDVHQWNALQAGVDFKLIDPDGLLAEAEYDLGVMMREDPLELLAGDPFERAHWLARRCGLDARAIWEWGVVERVSTGLLATKVGLQPVGAQMLLAADRVAALDGDW